MNFWTNLKAVKMSWKLPLSNREPYKIMVVCDDLKTMSKDDKEARFKKRKREDEAIVTDEFDDDFDFAEYVK